MKKVIGIIATLACAVSVHAASIDWSVTSNSWTLDSGSKPSLGMTVYLINAAEWDSIKSSIDGGAKSFTAGDKGIIDVATTSNAKGYVANRTATSASLVAGTTYDFAYLVFDSDANKYFASKAQSFAAYDKADPLYNEVNAVQFAGSDFSTSPLSGGWATPSPTSDIPEPTSGLLILIGASLLAIRRKQK